VPKSEIEIYETGEVKEEEGMRSICLFFFKKLY
jgi:hypothetical protein